MWDEDGPEVIGYAKRKEVGQTQYGPTDILILDVRNDEGNYEERSVWLMHTTLVSKLNRVKPGVGDLVGILQLGEREAKGGGTKYMDYNVVVSKKEGTALGWDEAEALPAGEPAQGEVVEAGRVVGTVAGEAIRETPAGTVAGPGSRSGQWESPQEPPDDYGW